MMAALEAARDALAEIEGLAQIGDEVSCRIGLEADISPAQYPLIRIVPTRVVPGRPYHQRTAEITIIFGAQIADSEGLETVYAGLFDLEAAILAVCKAQGWRYLDTITEPNPFEAPRAYKLLGVRVEMPAANSAPA